MDLILTFIVTILLIASTLPYFNKRVQYLIICITSGMSLLIILFLNYWKFQKMYNSSILSMITPKDIFSCRSEQHEQEYERLVIKGKNIAKIKRIVLCGMLRDAQSRFPELIKRIEFICKYFDYVTILIVENDSVDKTREILLNWSNKYNTNNNVNVEVLGCGINVESCKYSRPKTDGHVIDRTRIQKMVDLRNIYIDRIKEKYSDYDYCFMMDMDIIGSIYLDGIFNTLAWMEEHPNASVVCAFGIYRWGGVNIFYDTYAFLGKGEQFRIEDKSSHDIKHGLLGRKYMRGDEPFECESCFSGFAIYKMVDILNSEYSMSPEGELDCEHTRFNKTIDGEKYTNPSMVYCLLRNE